MPANVQRPGTPRMTRCPRCATVHPFDGVGGVCLRCAGERAFTDRSGGSGEFGADDLPAASGGSGSDAPARIGPYEIIEELGRGGMGCVFAASQSGLGRIVALKVLSVTGVPADLEMRFLREAQTVARLRHPHIVAIHDSGRADGFVYFSMDYLEGGDLGRRLREHPYTPTAAATLVAKVAHALAHAHAEGVLHRDIKPSNILLDGDEPRLADFGLAAQVGMSGDLTGKSGMLGTPHYLAPEAFRGGASLSAASDQYALGVVLYVLLTGRTPFAGASPAELPALIQEMDPPAPRLLAPAVPRDLETICLKCLERDPARRYAAVSGLADDLYRFLSGHAIAARPPGRLEHFRRFARRHRAAFVSSAVAITALVAATAVSSWLAVRATRAEKHAATEAAISRAVSEFLQNDLLAQASPDQQPDRDLKLRTVLDRAAQKIEGRFKDQPLVEAAVRETLASTYGSLGEHASEQHQLERAVGLLRRQLGEDDPRTLRLMTQLASSLAQQGKNQEANALGVRTLALTERVLGAADPQTLHAMNDLIFTTKALGHLAEAEALAARTLETARRALGPTHSETRDAMVNLASVYWSEHKLAEAEPLNVEAVAAERKALGPEHPDTLIAMSNLASVYWSEGKLADAERMGREILAIRQRVLGPEHPETLRTMNNLATTFTDENKFDEAITLHEQVLAVRQRVVGAEHPDTLSTEINLAMVYMAQGQYAPAEELLRPALEICERTLGPAHPYTMTALSNLTDLRRLQGRFAEAEAIGVRGLEARTHVAGADNPQVLLAQEALAATYIQEQKFSEAEALLKRVLVGWGKTAPDHWRTQAGRSLYGEALAGLRRFDEAEPVLLAANASLEKQAKTIPARYRRIVIETRQRLAQLYQAWGKPDQARSWQDQPAAGTGS